MANFVHKSNVNDLFKRKNQSSVSPTSVVKSAASGSPVPQPNRSIDPTTPASEEKLSFKTLTARRRPSWLSLKIIVPIIILLLTLTGVAAAFFLSRMSQDVRQQASGCLYYTGGGAAAEGSYDNRGGIRQQCVNGVWSQPDDGITDPRGMFEVAEVPPAPCRNWTGDTVSPGSYDNRGGIRQQCVNGLWDNPDDGITDPNDVSAIALADTLREIEGGDFEYEDVRGVFDQYCRTGMESSDANFCQNLSQELSQVEASLRADALTDRVQSNSERVRAALGGLNDRSVDYSAGTAVYREYCQGSNSVQTSTSACSDLRAELDEIAALRDQAAQTQATALTSAVRTNTDRVSFAIGGLNEGKLEYGEASAVYQQYCQGAAAQQTSVSVCQALNTELNEASRAISLTSQVEYNTDRVEFAVAGIESGSVDFSRASAIYQQYCQGATAQMTDTSKCNSLNDSLQEITQNVSATANQVQYAVTAVQSGLMDRDAAQDTYDRLCAGAAGTPVAVCANLSTTLANLPVEPEPVADSGEAVMTPAEFSTSVVNTTVIKLQSGALTLNEAQIFYNQLCTLAPSANRATEPACAELDQTLNEAKAVVAPQQPPARTGFLANLVSTVNNIIPGLRDESTPPPVTIGLVQSALNAVASGQVNQETAQNTYDRYCAGPASQSPACVRLQTVIPNLPTQPTTETPDQLATAAGGQGGPFQTIRNIGEQIRNVAITSNLNAAIDNLGSDLESYQKAQALYQAHCGQSTAEVVLTSAVCGNLNTALVESAPIYISTELQERQLDRSETLEFLSGLTYFRFNSPFSNNLSDVAGPTFRNFSYRPVDLNNLDELTGEDTSTATVFSCNLRMVCQVKTGDEVREVTLKYISDNMGEFNLNVSQRDTLHRNGFLVQHWTDGRVRETGDEVNPFEIRLCDQTCEWVVPDEQNLRGLAARVYRDRDNLDGVPDMDGDGYVLPNDLDIYLANSSVDQLLELVIENDNNWLNGSADLLLSNYDDGELFLEMPDVDDLEAINALLSDTSSVPRIAGHYKLSERFLPSDLTYWQADSANQNAAAYFSLNTLADKVSRVPFIGNLISRAADNAAGEIKNCTNVGSSLDTNNVCNLQQQIIRSVTIGNEVADLEDRTGIDIDYEGTLDYGTASFLQTAFEIMPAQYYAGVDHIILNDDDAESSGHTHGYGDIQVDLCSKCIQDERFWLQVTTVIHEVAHNNESTVIPPGNYCLDNGTCVQVENQTTGIELLTQALEADGITFGGNGLINARTRQLLPQFEEDKLAVGYFSPDDYAFTNLAEFYAEVLSQAIVDPENFAAANPELYATAVIINGFETETYIDEYGNQSIRRKSN